MGYAAGDLDRKVVLYKRAITGTTLGGYVEAGAAWGNYRQLAEMEQSVGRFAFTIKSGVLIVRDEKATRAIDSSFRIAIGGDDYEVRAAALPDFRQGTIRIDVATAPNRAAYEAKITQRGENITLRRVRSDGPPFEAQPRASVTGYSPDELVSGINQGDRDVTVLVEDLEKAGWPLPIKRNDKVVIRGRLMNVETVDDSTHRYAGVLNAYQLRVTG